jgi:hypothetical protein
MNAFDQLSVRKVRQGRTYCLCDLGALEIDVQVLVRHSYDLVHFSESLPASNVYLSLTVAKMGVETPYLAPPSGGFQLSTFVQSDASDDKFLLLPLTDRVA